MARRRAEVRPAVRAVAHAGAVPAVDEDAVHPVARHDLALHLGHQLEVVRTEAAGDPHLGRGPVPARAAVRVGRDPVGVRGLHVVVRRVRVGARQDDHPEPPAAGDQLAEDVPIAEPRAAVMEGNLRRVVGDAAPGAEADTVGARAPEVVEPEVDVELRRIVLDQRELRPAHRSVDPRRRGRHLGPLVAGGGTRETAEPDGRAGERGAGEKAAACWHGWIVPRNGTGFVANGLRRQPGRRWPPVAPRRAVPHRRRRDAPDDRGLRSPRDGVEAARVPAHRALVFG